MIGQRKVVWAAREEFWIKLNERSWKQNESGWFAILFVTRQYLLFEEFSDFMALLCGFFFFSEVAAIYDIDIAGAISDVGASELFKFLQVFA